MPKYESGAYEKCPHCQVPVRFTGSNRNVIGYNEDCKKKLIVTSTVCPHCKQYVLSLETVGGDQEREYVVWPYQFSRSVPNEVPPHIAEDYKEAAAVLSISPKASAALSRRCLQAVLREAGGADQRNLHDQIKHVISSLPSYIAESVDAIRNIGNFAAHPIKETASGQIVDVEPGEAEWNLDVLDMLFDFYYVQPEAAKKKRADLDAKLGAAGIKPML